jgi:uncharacterized protein (TIGR03435 family)
MRLLLFIALGTCVCGQPQFDAAAVKTEPPPDQSGHISSRMSVDDGRLAYTNVTLADVLEQAYKVQRNQISGPDWLDTDRFDITAKIPAGQREQIPQMLQALLADRFAMKLHRGTKELPIYLLTVGKNGPKFKSTETASGTTHNSTRLRSHVDIKGNMALFAEFLSTEVHRPVLDRTGLSGNFDLTLDWTPDDAPDSISIFTALQEQLDLKLDASRGPVELIVVDRAERTPSEN